MSNYNDNIASIQEVHRLIWPGEQIELFRAKHSRYATAEQGIWLREGTMPTSMYVSFMVFCLYCKFRSKPDRSHAANTFTQVCATVFSALNGLSLKHRQFGSNRTVRLCVSATGFVDAAMFWDGNYFGPRVRNTWKEDARNEAKPWISTRDGRGQVLFAELMSFCLDPQHGSGLKSELLGPTLVLFSQLAKAMDDNVSVFQNSSNILDASAVAVKNMVTVSHNVKSIWCEEIAQKIWSGEESGIAAYSQLFFGDNFMTCFD